jgi:hypothetical protein
MFKKITKYSNQTDRLVAFFGFLLFLVANSHYFKAGFYPGDDGDSRAVVYIFESITSKLVNFDTKNFFDTNFGFPWPDNLLRSEIMIGVFWIYAFFRKINFDSLASYKYFFICSMILNYMSAYYFSRKFKLSVLASSVSAFLFSSSLPIISQDVHSHLHFRAYIPPAIYYLNQFLQNNNLRDALLVLISLLLQLLTGLYLGASLIVFLTINFFMGSLKRKKNKFFEGVFFNSSKIKPIFLLLTTLILFIIVFIEFFVYMNFNNKFGISRNFNSENLFHISSFLMGNRSLLWTNYFQITSIPSHENQIFLGIGFFLSIGIFFLSKFNIESKIIKLILISTIINIIIFFSFGKLSPYKVIQFLPFFNTMRLPVRSIVVLIFPISIILGYIIDRIYFDKKIISILMINIAIFFIYFESTTAIKTLTNIDQVYSREQMIFSNIDNQIGDKKIFVYKKNVDNIDITDLDVMMYAQRNNLNTLNIFTTFLPQNFEQLTSCENVISYINSSKKLLKEKGFDDRVNFDRNDIAFINFKDECNY